GYRKVDAERYAAVWVQTGPKEEARLYVGVADPTHQITWQPLRDARLGPATLHALALPGGEVRYSAVWRKPAPAGTARVNDSEQDFTGALGADVDLAIDVSLVLQPGPVVSEAIAWQAATPWALLAWRGTRPMVDHPGRRYAVCWQANATLE